MKNIISPNDKYNQKLMDNVHPHGRVNPNPEPMYNLVVVGAGTAGLISAIATAGLGGKVALIERHLMGGDCLNVGCVPSKCLIRSARLAEEMRHAQKFGFTSQQIEASKFSEVMEELRRIRSEISENDSVERYTDAGVDVFIGHGAFTSKNTIEVDGKTLHFRKAVITSGARAFSPPISGLAEAGFLTNETIFNLTTLPKRLLVIGGGPIGCELAQAFSRLGSDVTIVQRGRFLPREDQEASVLLAEIFAKEGISVQLDAKISRVEKTESGNKIVVVEHDNKEICYEVDEVFVGVGRAPNVGNMGLEIAEVQYDIRQGIQVDDRLRTTNKNIYAAGDCCMQWKFTHAADAAAQIVVQNALFKGNKKLSSLLMPWCTYTDPEIAHVGMYEEEARAKGIAVDFFKFDMAKNDRALADREGRGFVKVMVKKGTDTILGATIVATHAGEMISEITTAMIAKIGLGKLGRVIHPYPTQADAIKRVAGMYNKSRLTPFLAKIFKWYLSFVR